MMSCTCYFGILSYSDELKTLTVEISQHRFFRFGLMIVRDRYTWLKDDEKSLCKPKRDQSSSDMFFLTIWQNPRNLGLVMARLIDLFSSQDEDQTLSCEAW